MYLLALIILIITGLVSILDILFGMKDLGEGIKLAVSISRLLFFASLLFFVTRMGIKKKD
ncbi:MULTISPECIES: hypothetical protein [Paenibacillus]|uniref:Uncharacterized protein n=1 Tax=Paenibacillus azoreducens TaxID=116718 RepID=A0A919YEY7_9BACL|nr:MULTISPECIES: hypothetical protein [Paenibacillus]MBE9913269.1 hypothetical protein [Paenibacillus donghaensis]GIO48033.1 hypothetical protein J34TS1_27980 [Paenibacillus azoreducens]